MRRGFLWLALVDLRQAWLRPGLAAVAIALAIVAVAMFAQQIGLRQAELLAGYEEAGAATFIADLSNVPDKDVDVLADAIRAVSKVRSVEAPYSGIGPEIVADTAFLVFRNDKQQEYLGARTNVLGVDRAFDPARDYYVNFNDVNPKAPQAVFGIPLLMTEGGAQAPGPGQLLVASAVADYIGVRLGAEAAVELVYTGVTPPIIRRLEGLRLIGTFDVIGPDQGRFEPFWRLAARGRDVLTVRRPDGETSVTTLPIILSAETVREFLAAIRQELAMAGATPPRSTERSQLVIRANSVVEVPSVEAAVRSLLEQHGLGPGCDIQGAGSFCLRLPERNNFQAAIEEQSKVEKGGAFFVALLLVMIAIGTAGLQIQTVLTRWYDYGVLEVIGFSPGQILGYYALRLSIVLAGSIAFAATASLMIPSVSAASIVSFAWAAVISIGSAGLAAMPVLLWPLSRSPAQLLRESV